ncbi:hypothetical protein BDP55DRAFT_718955 [Colletotrichum godetiae]|uniref:Uncharacterized protein n=1 Tax=Colletotrichum godetiae TaxID=1209918 RepID=A0AAJ0ACM2_9PEZI|nr:uncharacterized protein BDP55DRAFT_718955 [Colletotrichum godetiae]KAK1671456.1 hypothetical protein BDP55DRAFT_718955 [Colletotrichum godetiae]
MAAREEHIIAHTGQAPSHAATYFVERLVKRPEIMMLLSFGCNYHLWVMILYLSSRNTVPATSWTGAGPAGDKTLKISEAAGHGRNFRPESLLTPAVSHDMQQEPGKLPDSPLRKPRIMPVPRSREWACGQVACLPMKRDQCLIGASYEKHTRRI